MSAIVWLVVLCLGCMALGNYYSLERMKLEKRLRREGEDEPMKDLVQRLDKIERRMANLETIVLDREKQQEFECRL